MLVKRAYILSVVLDSIWNRLNGSGGALFSSQCCKYISWPEAPWFTLIFSSIDTLLGKISFAKNLNVCYCIFNSVMYSHSCCSKTVLLLYELFLPQKETFFEESHFWKLDSPRNILIFKNSPFVLRRSRRSYRFVKTWGWVINDLFFWVN